MKNSNETILEFMTFNDVMEAEIVKSKLESFEIPCSLSGLDTSFFNPLFNNNNDRIKLSIFERDWDLAVKVLTNEDGTKPEILYKADILCPKCNSANFESYTREKKKFNLLTFILSIFISALPANTEIVFKCKDCGNEFKSVN